MKKAYFIKMLSENIPYPSPLKPNTTHVIVGDFHNFRQTIHSRRVSLKLVFAHMTQPPDKLHDSITVEFHRPSEYAIDSYHHTLRIRLDVAVYCAQFERERRRRC